MQQKIYIDETKLSLILSMLSKFCKGKIRFFDDASQYYLSGHRENLSFCSILSRSPKTNFLCTRCNETANDRCRETRSCYRYFCHASLVEIMYPVLYDGIYVGHVSIGQFRSKQKTANDAYLSYLNELTGICLEKIRKAYFSQPLMSAEQIKGAELVLEMTANRLCEEGVFVTEHRDSVNRIEHYIRSNLSGDLSLNKIAEHVFMNPTYLSAMYHKATGVPLSKYIQCERITRASYLLSTTTMSIADVSAAAGFKDPNYFSKVFKMAVLCQPREYRRKLAKGEIIF